jgi:hypothetical protein
MFEDISVSDYVIEFDLQKAFFLRDCLYEEISYELNEDNVIIYKKQDNGISEEITLDELIFYIHTEVVEHVREFRRWVDDNPKTQFYHLFKDIDNIKKAVENMKIILKYDNDTSDEESTKQDASTEQSGTNAKEDNKTLAF